MSRIILGQPIEYWCRECGRMVQSISNEFYDNGVLDREDAIQDAIMRLLALPDGFQVDWPNAYVRRIVERVVIDLHRQGRKPINTNRTQVCNLDTLPSKQVERGQSPDKLTTYIDEALCGANLQLFRMINTGERSLDSRYDRSVMRMVIGDTADAFYTRVQRFRKKISNVANSYGSADNAPDTTRKSDYGLRSVHIDVLQKALGKHDERILERPCITACGADFDSLTNFVIETGLAAKTQKLPMHERMQSVAGNREYDKFSEGLQPNFTFWCDDSRTEEICMFLLTLAIGHGKFKDLDNMPEKDIISCSQYMMACMNLRLSSHTLVAIYEGRKLYTCLNGKLEEQTGRLFSSAVASMNVFFLDYTTAIFEVLDLENELAMTLAALVPMASFTGNTEVIARTVFKMDKLLESGRLQTKAERKLRAIRDASRDHHLSH